MEEEKSIYFKASIKLWERLDEAVTFLPKMNRKKFLTEALEKYLDERKDDIEKMKKASGDNK